VSGAYSAGDIEASLRLDRSEFNRELRQAKRDAEDFSKQDYSAKINVDDAEAKAKIAALKQELQNLRNFTLNANLTGFDGASAHLAALQATADHLNGMTITIHADINTTAAIASLAALRLSAADPINIRADIDTRTAAASLAALRTAANQPLNIPANVNGNNNNGTPSPNSPNVPGDGDNDGRNRKIKDPLPKIPLGPLFSLPGLIASVAPQIPALTTLLGGAAATAASFGVAAAGAFGVFALATKGAVTQAQAHKKAIDQTGLALKAAQQQLAGTKAGTQAYKNALEKVTEAEKAHKKALDALTPAEKQFNSALVGVKGAWTSFIGSTEKYTLKPVATVLGGVTGALPKLIPLVKTLAPEFQSVATAMHNWLDGDGMQRFVLFLQDVGYPIIHNMIQAFRGFLTAGGAVLRAFGPWAVRLSYYFEVLGKKADAWGRNGGPERFKDSVIRAWHQVEPYLVGLWKLIQHVWDVLSGTGQTNADALTGVISDISNAVGSVKPAAVKAFSEIFESISDVAVTLAPVIGITSKAIVDIVNVLPPGTIRAIADAMIAWKLAVLGWNAAVAVWGALTALIDGVSIAWATLNLVWYASPVIVIVAAIALLAGIIVLIATKTTWFQTIWHYAWEGIKTGALAVWNNVLKPAFNGIVFGLQTVGKWGVWLWDHALKPAWDGIKTGLSAAWTVMHPILSTIGGAFELVGKVIYKIVKALILTAFILVEAGIKVLWVFVLKPIFGFIKKGFELLGEGIMWVWKHGIKPAWELMSAAASFLWKHGLKPIFHGISDGWHDMVGDIKSVWTHNLKPAWDAVANKASDLYRKYIKPIFAAIADTIGDKWAWIKSHIFSPMGTFFTKTIPGWGTTMKNKLISAFDMAWKGIKTVWDNVKKAIGSPIYLVAKYVWNDAIYSIMSKIAGFVHQKNPLGKIDTDKIPHFATGGPVTGGQKGKDSVLSMLMPDEHVLTTADVSAMGGQQNVLRFRSALHGGAPVTGANSTGHFGIGGWIDDAGSALAGAASKTVGALKDAVLGAVGVVVNPLLNKAESAVDKFIPRDGGFDNLANSAMKQPIEWVKKFVDKQDSKAQAVGGVIPTGQHLAIIDAALKAAGVPPPGTKATWEAGMNTLIQRESGWNASAINNWDSNAKAGHPSQGLTQTIPSTFNAYVPASLRDRGILDPVANAAASIRYIVANYGNISNVQQANANKAPKGYWTGTSGAAPGMAWVGEKGPELIDFHGGETVYNNSDSMRMHRDGILGSLHGYASGTARVKHHYAERDRDTSARNSAQKRYDAAHTKYLNATTAAEQRKAKTEMARYSKQVDRLNKEIKNDNHLLALDKKRYKSAYDHITQERKDAATLAAAKKKAMSAELKTAQNYIAAKKAAVDAKLQVATDARAGYYDAAVQTGALSGLTGNRASSFISQIQDKIKAIKDFQTNLHTLAKLGLSRSLIQQIAAMGPEQGGALAQSLARTTTKDQASKLNSEYTQLEKASGKYADSAADDGFGLSKLKTQSAYLSKATIKVTAPHTILVNIGGKTFKAHTEKVVEEKVTEIVAAAGKKK
jgi:SLT domain-containing protein